MKKDEKGTANVKKFLPSLSPSVPTFRCLVCLSAAEDDGLKTQRTHVKRCKGKRGPFPLSYRPAARAGGLRTALLPSEGHCLSDSPLVKISADMAELSHNQN